MKDDSLNDTQQDKGGYCSMCDTVYDKPHECVGKRKSIGHPSVNNNVYATQIWNEAIEAAANLFPYGEWEEINIAAKIRKLKK